jgi:hypothetical protein
MWRIQVGPGAVLCSGDLIAGWICADNAFHHNHAHRLASHPAKGLLKISCEQNQ